MDPAERRHLRDLINGAWKEVYFQLGRNKSKPLNDDDFLRAHWMMYFKYSRQTGRDYIKFLLEEQFTPQRVHRKSVQRVELEESEEQTSANDLGVDDENEPDEAESSVLMVAELRPQEIREYVKSLKTSSVHWFRTFCPEMSDNLAVEEVEWIQRLNRLDMAYFRPLLRKKFENGQGYYGWSGLRYFLYEYELGLLSSSRQKKVDWADLLKTRKDKISIEHIYPQSETAAWEPAFRSIPKHKRGL